MVNQDITFDKLPEAVSYLINEIQEIKATLSLKTVPDNDKVDTIFDIKEAAAFLKLSATTIYSKVSKNVIPFMKKGNRLYFSKAKLIEYLEGGKNTTISEIEAAANSYIQQSNSNSK